METGLVSPWEPNGDALAYVTWAEHFKGATDAVTRKAAMQVPGIARGRALLVSAIADLPFYAYRNEEKLAEQPTWLYRTSGPMPIFHRTALTLDDLLFYGSSLWLKTSIDTDGYSLDMARVPFERWRADDRRIVIDDKPVSAEQVVFFFGPQEGLLATAANTIKGALATESSWIGRVQNPVPLVALTQTERGNVVPEDQIKRTIDAWSAARTSPTGAIGFVPYGLQLDVHGTVPTDLYVEGRNAIRLDVANHMNIPAGLLDGSTATASLTYTTQEGQRFSFHEQSVRYWLAPIEARLSQDDVVPRGQRVRADITYLSEQPPTGEPGED